MNKYWKLFSLMLVITLAFCLMLTAGCGGSDTIRNKSVTVPIKDSDDNFIAVIHATLTIDEVTGDPLYTDTVTVNPGYTYTADDVEYTITDTLITVKRIYTFTSTSGGAPISKTVIITLPNPGPTGGG